MHMKNCSQHERGRETCLWINRSSGREIKRNTQIENISPKYMYIVQCNKHHSIQSGCASNLTPKHLLRVSLLTSTANTFE